MAWFYLINVSQISMNKPSSNSSGTKFQQIFSNYSISYNLTILNSLKNEDQHYSTKCNTEYKTTSLSNRTPISKSIRRPAE